jgi:hypothetical protein
VLQLYTCTGSRVSSCPSDPWSTSLYPLVYITTLAWVHAFVPGRKKLSDFHDIWWDGLSNARGSFLQFTFHLLYFVPFGIAATALLFAVQVAAAMAGVVASAAVLAAGLLLALTKLLAVGDLNTLWRTAWSGPSQAEEGAGSAVQQQSNRKWMQLMILGELFLETIPQLCIQGINNSATQKFMDDGATAAGSGLIDRINRSETGWGTLAITSMAVSAAFALDTIWACTDCWHRHGCALHA